MHAFSRETMDSINACLDCHKQCLGMAMTHCLEEGGLHIEGPHFRLMIDCATICATAADFMLHKSEMHREMCGLCAAVCTRCADDCERLNGMESCIKSCRACADHCRRMAH